MVQEEEEVLDSWEMNSLDMKDAVVLALLVLQAVSSEGCDDETCSLLHPLLYPTNTILKYCIYKHFNKHNY